MYRLPNILHRTFKMTVSQGWVTKELNLVLVFYTVGLGGIPSK